MPTLMTWLLAVSIPLAASAPGPADAPFTLEFVSPRPLFLAGKCRIEAAAFDAGAQPYDAVAYMTLAVDGRPLPPDSEPPFAWDLDLGPDIARHRLELAAWSDGGRRVDLVVDSSAHPFVEAVGVDLVLVPVIVREEEPGGRNRALTGLQQEDFEVLEEGTPQTITSFSSEPVPASVVVALDNSRSMEGQLWSAQAAVKEFIDAQPVYNFCSLLSFNDQVFMEHDFANDRDTLARSVAAIRAEGTRTALYDLVRVASRHLARRPGARVLIVFTDGEETVYEGDEGRLQTAIEAAQASDVTVFAVAYGRADRAPLGRLTSETGGEMVAARTAGELRDAFARITESLGSRYVLGFEPAHPEKGGYRSLEVRVSRKGVRVLARKGYSMRGPSTP